MRVILLQGFLSSKHNWNNLNWLIETYYPLASLLCLQVLKQRLYCYLSVRVGNNMLDLVEVAKVEMVEPSGWINVDLDSGKDDSVRAFMLQVRFIRNQKPLTEEN